jgi:hypothetical protein
MRRTLRNDHQRNVVHCDGAPTHASQLTRGDTESGSEGIGIKIRRAERSNLSSIVARGLANIRTMDSMLVTRDNIKSGSGGELASVETDAEGSAGELHANVKIPVSDLEEGRGLRDQGTRDIVNNGHAVEHNSVDEGQDEEKEDSKARFEAIKSVA